jgi:hypothetical protein
VTSTALERPGAEPAIHEDQPTSPGEREAPSRSWFRRPLVACVLLLVVYLTASFVANDPGGTLGTDTGGKLATLRMMEHNGGLDPDVGYWAQAFDRHGDLHPLYYTYRIDDRWVNVTTLPMLDVAYPLYLVGGDRAVLLLPMLGAVLCAAGAAALARRLRGGDGLSVFWIVGLATPVAIYALDFWEHSTGLALMLWAVVLLYDVAQRRASWRGATVAGLLFGLAATMRTEALVYLVVSVGVLTLTMTLRDRSLRRPVLVGACAAIGAFVMLVANRLLEQVTFGADLRGGRVSNTAVGAGSSLTNRVHEALTTTVGLGFSALRPSSEWIVGGLAVAAVAGAAWCLRSSETRRVVTGVTLLAVAGFLYFARFSDGVGFVPGLLMASPFAIVGVVWAWRRPALRSVAAIAVLALPLVWLAQYQGGADAQWGGRYTLLSGALLTIVGVLAVAGARRALVGVVVLSAVVTLFGVAWLSVRSHTVADGARAIVARHDQMLISRQPHLFREAGTLYDPSARWLTATDDRELHRAVHIADELGVSEFGLVGGGDQPAPARIGGFVRGERQQVPFVRPDIDVSVVTYRRAP